MTPKLHTDEKLNRLLQEAKKKFEEMSDEEKEQMWNEQRKSWARQDYD